MLDRDELIQQWVFFEKEIQRQTDTLIATANADKNVLRAMRSAQRDIRMKLNMSQFELESYAKIAILEDELRSLELEHSNRGVISFFVYIAIGILLGILYASK